MAWLELTPKDLDGLALYAECVLKFFASDEHYEMQSNEWLAKQMVNKGANLRYYLYAEEKTDRRMAFGLKWSDSYPNPFTREKGMWKVVDLAYLGSWGDIDEATGVSMEALKFGVQSVRETVDGLKSPYGYIILNMDTMKLPDLPPEKRTQREVFLAFLRMAARIGEVTDAKSFSDGTHYVVHYDRTSKTQELTFSNPVAVLSVAAKEA
jgi:hypothetical protein